ncbi:MAG TPA: glycosyltransferase family 4 protein [Bacteroidales bacterium]|nr:glycosyltransferase family 4 protein [Bacteroidales bacterium]HSA42907.1 glycosyltransferase family 4 protein [Bacteroidales bacterium]
MNILMICNKPPYPPKDGGALAILSMIEGLLIQGHQLKVLAVNDTKYHANLAGLPEDFRRKTGLELIAVDLRINYLQALSHLLTGKSYHVSRFLSASMSSRLRELLKEPFDIVQFETAYPGVYLPLIRECTSAVVVLRAHNLEHLIWQRLAAGKRNPLIRKVLLRMTKSLKAFELDLFGKVDGIAAITPQDAAMISLTACRPRIETIPFGIKPDLYNTDNQYETSNSLFHIGSMDWLPNQEGVRWLLDKVWPLVIEKQPDAKLHLAGKNMPEWLQLRKQQGVIIEGEVDQAWNFMNRHAVMLVPLFSGSGVRIKIIEAMYAGRTVISTSVGAEGIACTSGAHLFIADTVEGFADTILYCLDHPLERKRVGQAAKALIEKEYRLDVVSARMGNFYRLLLSEAEAD